MMTNSAEDYLKEGRQITCYKLKLQKFWSNGLDKFRQFWAATRELVDSEKHTDPLKTSLTIFFYNS